MRYNIDYSADDQQPRPQAANDSQPAHYVQHYPPRRRFEIPSIVKTAATFAVAGAVFFGAEAFAPPQLRPSTWSGTYEARVTSAVKASELAQQAKLDAWAAEAKLSVEQQAEQYKALNQGFLAQYQARVDRGKLLASATAEIQKQYVASRMSQTQATQSTDVAIVNWTRMFGRFANALEAGSGDRALAYSSNLSSELSSELTQAAQNGQTISVEGWDTGLVSVDELRQQIDALKPIAIPPPPRLSEDPARLVATPVTR